MKAPAATEGDRWLAGCRRLLRACAWLAPVARRRSWLREWDGELVAWWRSRAAGPHPALARLRLARRSLLAVRDALNLRAIERRSSAAGIAAAAVPPAQLGRRRASRNAMDHLLADLRFAVRALNGRPTFTVVAVLTLGLGIGASTLITSAAWTVLWKPLDLPEPDRLVDVWPEMSWSKEHFDRLREEAVSYRSMVLWARGGYRLADADGTTTMVEGPEMSAGMLDVLGRPPALGRGFEPADERREDAGILLTHRGWQRRFGADPAVIGKTIGIEDRRREVVGVLAPGLDVLQAEAEVVLPARIDPEGTDWTAHYLHVVARLAPGISVAAADEELKRLAAAWQVAYGESDSWDRDAAVVPLAEARVRAVRPTMMLLLGAVACLLLVAAVNVAHLWLARALEREGEVTVRAVLGARPWRLAQQMLTESALLALVGGGLGLLFAVAGVDALRALLPADTPRLSELRLDGWTLLFSLLITLGVGWIVALLPSFFAARRSLRPGERATATAGRGRLRGALVVAEVTLAVVLLVAAGVLIKSFARTLSVDLGFAPRGLLTLWVVPEKGKLGNPQALEDYYRDLQAELAAVPGVTGASLTHALPVQNPGWNMEIFPEGAPPEAGAARTLASWRPITPEYFATVGIRLLEGRAFGPDDRVEGPRVAVLNETAVRTLFPDGDVLGRRLGLPWEGAEPITVVGVVGDVKLRGPRAAPPLVIYRPYAQAADRLSRMGYGTRSVALRTVGDPRALIAPVRARIRAHDPTVAVTRLMSMDDILANARAEPRLVVLLVTLFAGAGLLLGAVGMFGVMECAVRERGKELSIRVALGADRGRVIASVLGRGLRLAAVGGALGVGGAVAAAGVLEAHLFEVSARDPSVYAVVAATLAAVALAASWWPARRASRSDPIAALRAD